MSSISVAVKHPKISSLKLDLSPEKQVLDVGCGLGGAARFVASRYGCRVTGIDLTPEYVKPQGSCAGGSAWTTAFRLNQGSALALPFADRAFDRAYVSTSA